MTTLPRVPLSRRSFLGAAAATTLIGAAPVPSITPGWRRFEITTRVTLPDDADPAQLWLPVAQDAPAYQSRLGLDWHGSGQARLVHDAVYGAPLLRVDWTGGPKTVALLQTVATRDRDTATMPATTLTAAERRFWTRPTESLPTDGIVRDTAMRITADCTTQREKLHAIYDWVVEQTTRDPHTPGCGTGDIRTMLRTGRLGGKCADINSLMTGLSRAAGLPARDVYGIRVAASRLYPSLGASGTISKAQHCRSEIHLDEAGWVPVDPADVRKLMLEQHMALDHPLVQAARARMLGGWEMNWIGYNSATDIVLPGAVPGHVPNFPFLMYPCAFTRAGQPDCLDPAGFRYDIGAREVTA